MRQFLASLLVISAAGTAAANGRAPSTSTINFRQGHESDVWVGLTFGALVSHDSGATWYWTCEDAVGYAGTWDPDYAYSASGKVFATTFAGTVVNSNGCVFDRAPFAATPLFKDATSNKFATSEELGPNGELYVAVDEMTDGKIYKSVDDGATFPTGNGPGMSGDWWQTLIVAKSNPNRVYASGYRFVPDPSGEAGNIEQYTLFRSDNGGTSYVPLSQTGIQFSSDSVLEFAGVSTTNPDVVFLRVTFAAGVIGDTIYRSGDGGANWTKVLDKGDAVGAFVVRANGDVVAGTPRSGAFVSHDCTAAATCTWSALLSPPHTNCFVENALGEIWACTQNFGSPGSPGDGYGIMKTTDLANWTSVLKYQDIKGPIACDAGSVQNQKCTIQQWCGVKGQIGITADPTMCPVTMADGQGADSGITQIKKPTGCCDTGGNRGVAPGAVMLSMIAGVTLLRRRRR